MKEKAAVLPALLISFSIASLIIMPLFQYAVRVTRKVSEEDISSRLNNSVNSKLLLKSYAQSAGLVTALQCFNETGKYKWVERSSRFCALYFKVQSLNNTLIEYSNASLDFDSLQNSTRDCWQTLTALEPELIIKSGYFSGFNCNIENTALLNDTQINSNLLISQQLNLQNAVALSVKGFTHIKKMVFNNQKEFTLFSAGEILIDEIQAFLPLSLKLISASGDITIKKITGLVKISSFSRGKISLPTGTALNTEGFSKLQLDYLPVGFITP
jgi:hypothetical protein